MLTKDWIIYVQKKILLVDFNVPELPKLNPPIFPGSDGLPKVKLAKGLGLDSSDFFCAGATSVDFGCCIVGDHSNVKPPILLAIGLGSALSVLVVDFVQITVVAVSVFFELKWNC